MTALTDKIQTTVVMTTLKRARPYHNNNNNEQQQQQRTTTTTATATTTRNIQDDRHVLSMTVFTIMCWHLVILIWPIFQRQYQVLAT